MLPLKCKRCEERRTWRYMALNEGSNGGETGSSGRFQFLCRTFFSLRRDAVSPCSEKKHFPTALISPPHTRDFPHFQCFTCKNVLIGYKNLNSRYFLLPSSSSSSFFFLLPYSFALKNTFAFFKSSSHLSLSLSLSFLFFKF